MSVKVRFAPSPTGVLHVGNIRIAILNYIFARQNSGIFLLRIDDTDEQRSQKIYEEQIVRDLEWLGFDYDEYAVQSQNFKSYADAFEILKERRLVYPCFETQEELQLARKMQLANKQPPVYKRKILSETEIDEKKKSGSKVYWRFALKQDATEKWNDMIHGEVGVKISSISDPVIIKPDGSYTYTFASVVDDVNLGITHIIRGDDHITNTGCQIQLFKALTSNIPYFGHVPLMTSSDGEEVSKRKSSKYSICELRDQGVEPMAILSVLAGFSGAYQYSENDTFNDVIDKFDFSKIALSSVKFDLQNVYHMSKKIISTYDYSVVEKKIADFAEALNLKLNISDMHLFWDFIKTNIDSIHEVKKWLEICYSDSVNYVSDDKEFSLVLFDSFNATDSWETFIAYVKSKTDRRGKALFHEIRLIFTGENSGPELQYLYRIIPKNLIYRRIEKSCN